MSEFVRLVAERAEWERAHAVATERAVRQLFPEYEGVHYALLRDLTSSVLFAVSVAYRPGGGLFVDRWVRMDTGATADLEFHEEDVPDE